MKIIEPYLMWQNQEFEKILSNQTQRASEKQLNCVPVLDFKMKEKELTD